MFRIKAGGMGRKIERVEVLTEGWALEIKFSNLEYIRVVGWRGFCSARRKYVYEVLIDG